MRLPTTRAVVLLATITLPAAARAQLLSLDKLQVHGYLTQGYAESSQFGFNGIPTEPTANVRTAALQFRYSLTTNDNVTVQLRHRRLGADPLQAAEPDLALNWAFYQHRFGGLAVKGGRLPIPRGIYNEIRAVGTIMPFFRAPIGTYIEGFETLTGAVAAYTIPISRSWSLETVAYGGSWEAKIVPPQIPTGAGPNAGAASAPADSTGAVGAAGVAGAPRVMQVHERQTVGGQTWLNTPLQGLRVGLSGMRFTPQVPAGFGGPAIGRSNLWTGSVDGNFDRFLARAEFTHVAIASGHQIQYYGQAGMKLSDRIGVYVQHDRADAREGIGGGKYFGYLGSRDTGVSLNYGLAGGRAVLKIEEHGMKGHNFDTPLAPTDPSRATNYTIASLSAAF